MCIKYFDKPVRNLKAAFTIAVILFFISASAQTTSVIPNPVLPGVADAGVLKFNGEYYIGGVNTKGSFYKSYDLVNWTGPRHVFTMNNEWATKLGIGNEQIHSNDINYINGKFHMYWNVNYWSKDTNVIHIGHATASDISGPFNEPVKDTWFDGRLDPKLFVDDDYKMYFYTVKFTEGNTIWVRPMKDPNTLSGDSKLVFASLPNTWETIDNRVEEGPWVFKYRNRYYLLFNSNHTATEWGNYAMEVAQANGPLEFNNNNKYPYPVIKSNQIDLEELHADVLKYQGESGSFFQYSLHQPDQDWNQPGFADRDWQTGKEGFGSVKIEHSTSRIVKTIWKDENIWMRKKFTLNEQSLDNFSLRVHHDGDTKVFLNGSLIYDGKGSNYFMLNLDTSSRLVLKKGENILAVYSAKGRMSNFIDVSIFDMKKDRADDILYSPGQGNLLKGPNGFEWWLIYMANKNDERRGQFINRIYFFDKRLVSDGITSKGTSGYHPIPSQPSFNDLFNDSSIQLNNRWNLKSGNWKIVNNELALQSGGTGMAFIKNRAAENYLFEASVKTNLKNKAGIYAWWKDDRNWVKIVLDPIKKSWEYELCSNNKISTNYYILPGDFNYGVYHSVSVYKNDAVFTITIDNLPAPIHSILKTNNSESGIPGLYTEGVNTAFDGILYTIGWDESDKLVTGWKSLKNKEAWQVTDSGINASTQLNEDAAAFKGDMLNAYEFSVQLKTENSSGLVGLYPVYIDQDNFLKAFFDYKNKEFVVTGKLHGQSITPQEAKLEELNSYYANITQSDSLGKHFMLNSDTYINGLRFNKAALPDNDSLIQNIHNKVNIFYKSGDRWLPLTNYRSMNTDHPGFDRIEFNPIKTGELKFENKDTLDHYFYVNKLWVNELFRQSYNLRIVKQPDVIIFFVDNKQVLQVKNNFPASRVGLYANDCKANFNGIMLYHLPDKK